jgi:hypothetical protein
MVKLVENHSRYILPLLESVVELLPRRRRANGFDNRCKIYAEVKGFKSGLKSLDDYQTCQEIRTLMYVFSCNKLLFSFNRLIKSKISIWFLSIKSLCYQVTETGDPTIPDKDASAGNLLHVYGVGLPKRIRIEEYSCC